MTRHRTWRTVLVHLAVCLSVLAFAFALRKYFFCGFLLADDAQEFAVATYILNNPPILNDQLHLRFGGWLPLYVSLKLLGVSETAFFLPTWVASSGLGLLAYALLLFWGYAAAQAWLAALFVTSAPFEIMMGTVRSNDLFLAWSLALGFTLLVFLEKRPVLQGIALAVCLWFGFYVKLFAVYALPALAFYFVVQLRAGRWRSLVAFSSASILLHGATSLYWKTQIDVFFPFFSSHAASYRVMRTDLAYVFLRYPRMILFGSEFGTTLFGLVPYLLALLLLLKTLGPLLPGRLSPRLRFDRADLLLFVFYGSFLMFLNFWPNSFHLDGYYSVPRIFRYLTPISFPMTLHLAKMLLDVPRIFERGVVSRQHAPALIGIFVPLIALNLLQADEATKPGQMYRRAFMGILEDVKAAAPPKLVVDSWVASWMKDLYLDRERDKTVVVVPYETYAARDHEKWLNEQQASLPEGSMLVTGLGSYVHYGAHLEGFRLSQFAGGLDPRWELFKDYGMLSYLPVPEPARLWRLRGSGAPPVDG